jgi:two-component system, LytTR family, response regulator
MVQVLIPTGSGTKAIMTHNIIRIQANSNYSKLFFKHGHPLTVAKVLHWFEDKLAADYFYRVNKTHIVNKLFIAAISTDKNMLTLTDGEQLKISRRRKEMVLKRLA